MGNITPLYKLVEELPTKNMTTRVLGALDYLVPGQWSNVTNFETLVKDVTGETDQALIQQVGDRANKLYASEANYQRAMSIFSALDSIDKAVGAAVVASQVGHKISFLGFLEKLTPKPDKAQAVDAGAKLVGELTTFCLVSGLPGDSVADFAKALIAYGKEDRMRLMAWLVIDGVLPLGPDFIGMLNDSFRTMNDSDVPGNSTLGKLKEYLPAGSSVELVRNTLGAVSGYLDGLVKEHNLSRESLGEKIKGVVEVTDGRLDLLAAALDISTDYFHHTGTQSVARRIVSRAYAEI